MNFSRSLETPSTMPVAAEGEKAPAPVLGRLTGATAVLTLNRPDRLNALDREIIGWLHDMLDEIEGEPGIRTVIITGTGDRAFSAGADLRELAADLRTDPNSAGAGFTRRGQALTRRIETFPKPVVAAVNGLALGGGCELVEAAHIALASERAEFGKPEIGLGFPPPFGGTQRLPRHVGRKRALAMILSGDRIGAVEAERIGLINRIVPHNALMEEARRLADRLGTHAPAAIASCLFAVTRGINLSIDEGLAVEAAEFERAVRGDVVQASLDAFLRRKASPAADAGAG